MPHPGLPPKRRTASRRRPERVRLSDRVANQL